METHSTGSTPSTEPVVSLSNHSGPASSTQALNDLLAALPEMFPGDQEIPLSNIRPNPENPGPPITEEQIQELADNMAERGLLNHIRVQPDLANPLAPGVAMHPENPRLAVSTVEPLKADGRPLRQAQGRPWELADFNFIVLTGENRYRSAGRLQWRTIKGTILNPTPLEAVEITHLDNATRKRGWWADYQSIERAIKVAPNLTQTQVATRLKLSRESVGWAIGLLPLLNAEARGLISRIPTNSNKGNKGISETAASWLADLGPGTGLKRGVRKKDPTDDQDAPKLWPSPPIPPETQDLVRRALAVALNQGLTEAGVKSLVGWVQQGNAPETFKAPGKSPKGKRAKGEDQETAKDLGKSVKVEKVKGKGPDQATPAQEASTPLEEVREKVRAGGEPTTKEHLAVAGHVAGIGAKWLWGWASPLIEKFFKSVAKLAGKAVNYFAGIFKEAFGTVARPILKWGMIIGLVLWVIWKLFHPAWVSWGFHQYILGPLTRFHHDSPASAEKAPSSPSDLPPFFVPLPISHHKPNLLNPLAA